MANKFVSDTLQAMLDENVYESMGLGLSDINPLHTPKNHLFVIGDLTEYDMVKSNISVAYELDAITKAEYDNYLAMPSKDRKVKMGLWYRDNPILKDKVINGQHAFVDKLINDNNIDPKHIIFRVFDAIWVYDVFPTKLVFGEKKIVSFVKKTKATSMLFIGTYNAKFFYNSYTDELIVKGLRVIADGTTMYSYIKKMLLLAESNKHRELYLFFHQNKLTYKNEGVFYKEQPTFNFAVQETVEELRKVKIAKMEWDLFEDIAFTLMGSNYGQSLLK